MQTGLAEKITATAIILCVTLMASASIASASETRMGEAGFHPPKTRQEKWLDAVLQNAEKQEPDLTSYMLGNADVKASAKSFADMHFSPELLARIKSREIAEIQKNCGGVNRSDEVCGTDYIPYLCAQDGEKFSYKTTSDKNGKITRTVIKLLIGAEPQPAATYTIVNGRIVGIQCAFE